MSWLAPRAVAELEPLEPEHPPAAARQLVGRGAAERAETDDDVVEALSHPCPAAGSSQRRMSALSSSMGANQPWV